MDVMEQSNVIPSPCMQLAEFSLILLWVSRVPESIKSVAEIICQNIHKKELHTQIILKNMFRSYRPTSIPRLTSVDILAIEFI